MYGRFWLCFVLCYFNFTPLYPAISMLKCCFSLLEQTPTDIRMSLLKSVLQCGERILSQDIKLAKTVHLITMLIDEIQTKCFHFLEENCIPTTKKTPFILLLTLHLISKYFIFRMICMIS